MIDIRMEDSSWMDLDENHGSSYLFLFPSRGVSVSTAFANEGLIQPVASAGYITFKGDNIVIAGNEREKIFKIWEYSIDEDIMFLQEFKGECIKKYSKIEFEDLMPEYVKIITKSVNKLKSVCKSGEPLADL